MNGHVKVAVMLIGLGLSTAAHGQQKFRVIDTASNDVLNVRERPTTASRLIGSIPPDGRGIVSDGRRIGNWIFVRYKSTEGWVSSRFVGPDRHLVDQIPDQSVQFRWTLESGNGGTLTASIRNAAGSIFDISCTIGEGEKRPLEIAFTPSNMLLGKSEQIQIVIDENAFPFQFSDKYGALSRVATLGMRLENTKAERLIDTLVTSKSNNFNIEVPSIGRSEVFSLKDARKSLIDNSQTAERWSQSCL